MKSERNELERQDKLKVRNMSKAKSWYSGAFPRQRDKHEPPPIKPSEKKLPSKEWKKKYECKKAKGNHNWTPISIHNHLEYHYEYPTGAEAFGFYRYPGKLPIDFYGQEIPIKDMGVCSTVEWRCTACNKHEREYLASKREKSLLGGAYQFKKKLNPYRRNY